MITSFSQCFIHFDLISGILGVASRLLNLLNHDEDPNNPTNPGAVPAARQWSSRFNSPRSFLSDYGFSAA